MAVEADRSDLFGEPIPEPEEGSTGARFSSGALSTAFRAALEAEGVEGEIEAVDCSEHPCIVFGRLAGDEEDVEEIERSPALREYEDDVLTLLLWAVSTDSDAAEHQPKEAALFAVAFYTREERSRMADRLDRRIRARVVEVWNTDRPGESRSSSEE